MPSRPPAMPRRPPETSRTRGGCLTRPQVISETRAEFEQAKVGYARARRLQKLPSARTTPKSQATSTTWACAAGPGRSGGRQGGLRAGAGDRRGELRARPPRRRHRVNNLGGVLQDLGDLAGARAAFERALADRRGELRARPPRGRHRRQQPGRCAAGPGRSGGRPGGLRAGARGSTRRASGPTTPTSPPTSTTWAGCCRTWAIWRAPGRPSSGRWRSTRRASGRATRRAVLGLAQAVGPVQNDLRAPDLALGRRRPLRHQPLQRAALLGRDRQGSDRTCHTSQCPLPCSFCTAFCETLH